MNYISKLSGGVVIFEPKAIAAFFILHFEHDVTKQTLVLNYAPTTANERYTTVYVQAADVANLRVGEYKLTIYPANDNIDKDITNKSVIFVGKLKLND
jgi:hypothetical protein